MFQLRVQWIHFKKGGLFMGTVTVTGAIIILTGWFALVEYDSFPEAERKKIIQKIKNSPIYMLLVALMPIGIVVNGLGAAFGSVWMMVLGSTLILIQGIIVALLFWKRKRWKSILLLIVMVGLGIFIYVPLFLVR